MLFRAATLPRIADGSITLAFRRQRRPTVRAGRTLTTPVGVLAIDDVRTVTDDEIAEDDARRAGYATRDELLADLGPPHEDRQLYRVELHVAGPDPRIAQRAHDDLSDDDVADLSVRLARLDRASTHGPWTADVLALIASGRPFGPAISPMRWVGSGSRSRPTSAS